MNITELRAKFLSVSGRMDLAEADIDGYLNAGQKLLDDLTHYVNCPTEVFGQVGQGAYGYVMQHGVKTLDSVCLVAADGQQKSLSYLPLKELWLLNPGLLSVTTQGTPEFYSTSSGLLRFDDETDETDIPGSAVVAMDNSAYVGALMFNCPAEAKFLLRLSGIFYTPKLSNKVKQTWWSVNYPELVVTAANYHVAVDMRNADAMKEDLAVVKFRINELINNSIEADSVDRTVQKG